MLINLLSRWDLNSQLEAMINLDGYEPKDSDVPEMAQNILDVYSYELDDIGREYITIPDDRINDIISFVKSCGGYHLFDFVV